MKKKKEIFYARTTREKEKGGAESIIHIYIYIHIRSRLIIVNRLAKRCVVVFDIFTHKFSPDETLYG